MDQILLQKVLDCISDYTTNWTEGEKHDDRKFHSDHQLEWGTDSLIIRKNRIAASEIKVICIDGSIVGILPAGKRIVPVHLCFRFTEDPAAAMKRLIIWAEENGIRLKYKKFVRWL